MIINPIYDMGVIKPGSTTPTSWQLTEGAPKIIKVVPDCGCTAHISWDDNGLISATFTEEDTAKLTDEQKKSWYPSGRVPVTKGITVYFDDGKDLQVIVNGRADYNPDKLQEKLTLIGYVDVSESGLEIRS